MTSKFKSDTVMELAITETLERLRELREKAAYQGGTESTNYKVFDRAIIEKIKMQEAK